MSKKFEIQLKNDVSEIFTKIIKSFNYKLKLRVNSRAGAEISDILEKKFVNYIKANGHERIFNPLSSPEGATKNPFDIKFDFVLNNHSELVWGDIKTFNSKYKNSNPDLGTVNKVLNFMLDGNFYILFILFEYTAIDNDYIKFEIYDTINKPVRVELLKDIHPSFRLNPKNQLQVNYKVPFLEKTKKEFIDLLEKKYIESFKRQKEKAEKKLKGAKELFEKVRKIQKSI